jgi:hypothetical protein
VNWADAQFHHVELHSQGGATTLDNGALVHKDCHPKSAKAVAEFAAHWRAKLTSEPDDGRAPQSSGRAVTNTPTTGRHHEELSGGIKLSEVPAIKRGRPKVSVQQKLVAKFLKLGLSPEKARDTAREVLAKSAKA